MIRNIVGGLLYVGKGSIEVDDFKELFLAKNRTKSPPTFMADGLYLSNITYADNLFQSI